MADLDDEFSAGSEPVAEQQPTTEQNRDEAGRYAEGQNEPQQGGEPQAPAEGDPPRQQMVPHAALHAAKQEVKSYQERYSTLEARFADLQRQTEQMMGMLRQPPQQPQQPQQRPDWFADPDAAMQHGVREALTPLEQQMQAQREGFSKMMAVDKFGAEAVQAAEAELAQRARSNPDGTRYDYQRIMASPHPYGELMAWHKQQSVLSRVGTDPDAWIEQELQRRLAAMGHAPAPQQAAPQQGYAPQSNPPPQAMPGNFANGRSAAPRVPAGASTGPRPLADIFGGR